MGDEVIRVIRHAVRIRPAMYIGAVGVEGQYLLVEQVVRSVEADELDVIASPEGWVTVTFREVRAIPSMRFGLCRIGPRGVDRILPFEMWTVSELAERCEIELWHGGMRWQSAFEHGEVTDDWRGTPTDGRFDVRVRFRPDPQIFGDIALDLARLGRRLRELAWMRPATQIRYQQERLPSAGGLRGWAEQLGGVVLVSRHERVDVHDLEVVVARGAAPMIRTFVNEVESFAGTHVDGLRQALATFAGEPIALLHLRTPDPRFDDVRRRNLVHPRVTDLVRSLARLLE